MRASALIQFKPGNILLLLMLPAVCWLFFNTTANRHIHVMSGGYVISHAHPFHKDYQDAFPLNGQEFPSHQHTKKELLLLSLFSELLFSIITLVILRPLIYASPQIRCFRMTRRAPSREHYQVHHYHAPPVSG